MVTPITMVTLAAAPPATSPAITWWPGPTGKARRCPVSRRYSGRAPSSRRWPTAPSTLTRRTCRTWSKIQAGYKVQPLSEYLKQPVPPAPPAVDFPKINKEMMKTGFFDYLAFALQFAPGGPEEKAIREKLARLGIEAGKKFAFKDLSPEQQEQVVAGVKEGEAKIVQYLESGQKNVNGWKVGSLFGDSAFYNGDWLKRAAAAKAGIYGNDAAEAMYPMTKTLANGEPLDGSNHNYTLTFAAGQFPPVNAFWSVTMYDGKSQLLIKKPINRYLINSPMLPNVKKNKNGSLPLYIQKD